jgi:hypothetical protein
MLAGKDCTGRIFSLVWNLFLEKKIPNVFSNSKIQKLFDRSCSGFNLGLPDGLGGELGLSQIILSLSAALL